MDDQTIVLAIEATVGGGSSFVLSKRAETMLFTSSSAVVQLALLGAFLTGADVTVETEGNTKVIRRVDPFAPGDGPQFISPGSHTVSRVATQRDPAGADHLEVFLKKTGSDQETAYNVYDPLLQQLLMAVFQYSQSLPPPQKEIPLDVDADSTSLFSVRIGEPALPA